MHALDIGAAAEPADQVSVEARCETSGARRGRDEIDIARVPAGPCQGAARRRLTEVQGAVAEAIVELVDRLVRVEGRRIDPEMPAVDVAAPEEAASLLVGVAGEREDLRLGEPMRRCRGGDGRDLRERHSHLRSIPRSIPRSSKMRNQFRGYCGGPADATVQLRG